MSVKEIMYEIENFNLQKLSDAYGLSNIKDYKLFLGKLMDKGVISGSTNNRQILEKGESRLTFADEGLYQFTCSYYDWLIWDNYGIYFKPECGSKNKLKSNMEIMALKEFING